MNKQQLCITLTLCFALLVGSVWAQTGFKEISERDFLTTTSLQRLREQWENGKKQQDWKTRKKVLYAQISNSDGLNPRLFYEVTTGTFQNAYCLKFSSSQLNDFICDMFLYESEISKSKKDIPDDTDNEDGGYYYVLGSVAASTFSPKIYDQMWKLGREAILFNEYIARVNPEKTLSLLLAAVSDTTSIGREDIDYLIPQENSYIHLTELLGVLTQISILYPDIAERQNTLILAFVKVKALNYSKHKGMQIADYFARLRVLNLLQRIGSSKDKKFIYEELIKNAPPAPKAYKVDLDASRENTGMELDAKAQKVMENIVAREDAKSQNPKSLPSPMH
jgi:hypothetical protein